MIVQHNISAMNANRNLGVTTGQLSKSTEKLSSGYRINRAGDDAAGLAISEKMRGQIRGLGQASTNSEDGISLIQTAEGALQETQSIIQRMRELSVQAANDSNTDDDRAQIQSEVTQLTQEVDRIATTSEFNTKKLLDGSVKGVTTKEVGKAGGEATFTNGKASLLALSAKGADKADKTDVVRLVAKIDITQTSAVAIGSFDSTALNGSNASVATLGTSDATITLNGVNFKISGALNIKAGDVITLSTTKAVAAAQEEVGKESLRFQVGANFGQEVTLGIGSMKATDLDIVRTDTGHEGEALDVTSQKKASLAIKAFDNALQKVSGERSKLGAVQNRLEHTIANLDTSEENVQAAEARIRDVDMADEMTKYSKSNILMQAGQSMLAPGKSSTRRRYVGFSVAAASAGRNVSFSSSPVLAARAEAGYFSFKPVSW